MSLLYSERCAVCKTLRRTHIYGVKCSAFTLYMEVVPILQEKIYPMGYLVLVAIFRHQLGDPLSRERRTNYELCSS